MIADEDTDELIFKLVYSLFNAHYLQIPNTNTFISEKLFKELFQYHQLKTPI
jgi:hypothetical protein